jgi:hypothetical protein
MSNDTTPNVENQPRGRLNCVGRVSVAHHMGALVVVSRTGSRWRADVYSRTGLGVRLVAEVVGSEACVCRVAEEAVFILRQPNGESLLADFLSANRCRVTRGP